MKNQLTNLLKVSVLGLSFVSVLAACSKNDEPKSDDRAIKPTTPVEQSVDGFQTARIYKGAWRPTIACVSRENASLKLNIDLWDHTLKYGGTTDVVGTTRGANVFETPELSGKPLGTDRTWNLLGLPLELAGTSDAILKIDRFGHGFILARRSGLSCAKCGEMIPKFDCEEAAVPYEQKFVQAACGGDAAFVDSFMTRYPNVPDYINQVGVLGETALTCALKNGNTSVIETLLNQLDSGLDFSAGNLNGEMPLFIDMDGSAKYAGEWQRRSDVDLNRLDNRHRTVLHTKTATNSTLRALLASPRFSPGILSVENNLHTTGLGALVQKNFGTGAIEAFELAKTRTTITMERPAIEGLSYLEYAVKMGSAPMARYFLAEKSQQRLPNGGSANDLVFLAAQGCDVEFIKLLDQRRDVDFTATRGSANAIDVARSSCSYPDAIIEALTKRGVPDRLDPVVPACKDDVTGFKNSLSNGAMMGSKTGRVMQCIWNRPAMLQLVSQYPSAGWDWPTVETYATTAFGSGDQNLVAIYLNQMPWPSSSGVYQRMRDAIASKQITVSQYFDALSARSALSDTNLRMGPYNHLLFSLIADGDANRVSQYLTQVSTGSWPTLDLSTQPAIADYYMSEYKDLLAADRCNITPKLAENPLRFAMRTGQNAIAQAIASRMRSNYAADFGSQSFSCNGSYNVQLMNVLSLAIKQCQTGLIKYAYEIRSKYEGAGSNKFVRRTPWDVLARSKCSADQARALAGELLDTLGTPDDSSIVTDGANSQVVISVLKDRGYKTQQILTPDLSVTYPAVMLVDRDANTGDFRRTDNRVIAGTQYVLRKTGGSGTSMDYSLDSKNMISFAGISDYVSFYYPDYYKKNGCLLIIDDGASLNMKDGSSLAITKITVCKNTLRFKFNPTTSESATPIRNYVDGEFSYSLEGLDEATGTNAKD